MMIENKQTAVEWLIEQIDDIYLHSIYGKEFEQAKEMEKENTINFALQHMFGITDVGINLKSDCTQKYNETFKSE
jgi:hypothetical protein